MYFLLFQILVYLNLYSCKLQLSRESYLGKAYIITTKPTIPDNARNVAERCGFRPTHLAAVVPYSDLFPDKQSFCQSCFYTSSPSSEKVPESELTLGQISLACSTKKAFNLISTDNDLKEDDWYIYIYIFYFFVILFSLINVS